MNSFTRRILFWAPRILTILYAIFIIIFVCDPPSLFSGDSFWRYVLAMVINLIMWLIMLGVILISWRWEIVGALLFAASALFYALHTMKHPGWILLTSGPLSLVAILFFMNWLYRKELRKSS
jgi:hypothetical protein